MLTTSTCEGGTTRGVQLGGIKQQGKRGAGLQREQRTANRPGHDTRIKGNLRKSLSDWQHQESSGKAPTHGHKWTPQQNCCAFRNKKCFGVRSRAWCCKRLQTSLFQGQGYRQPLNTQGFIFFASEGYLDAWVNPSDPFSRLINQNTG